MNGTEKYHIVGIGQGMRGYANATATLRFEGEFVYTDLMLISILTAICR
jgi:hypothetical protein